MHKTENISFNSSLKITRKRDNCVALQLEAARATPVLFRFNYNAMPSLKSLNQSIAVL